MDRAARILYAALGVLFVAAAVATPAQAQVGPYYYYPAAGDYATSKGTVHIQTAGYYSNVPVSAVPLDSRASEGRASLTAVSSTTSTAVSAASRVSPSPVVSEVATRAPVAPQPLARPLAVAPPPVYVAPTVPYYSAAPAYAPSPAAPVMRSRPAREPDYSWLFKY